MFILQNCEFGHTHTTTHKVQETTETSQVCNVSWYELSNTVRPKTSRPHSQGTIVHSDKKPSVSGNNSGSLNAVQPNQSSRKEQRSDVDIKPSISNGHTGLQTDTDSEWENTNPSNYSNDPSSLSRALNAIEVCDIDFERPGTRSIACQVNYEFLFESIALTVKRVIDTLVKTVDTELETRITANGMTFYLRKQKRVD